MIHIAKTNETEKTMMRDIYCAEMMRMANEDKRVYAMDADLVNSIGMSPFANEMPERLINCGIQEANMVCTAAGMSATGLIPFIHTFAVFASRRVYDQIFLSLGFSKWNVKIIGSDPGITAAYNGATHMPFEDMGILRNVPGITILEPTDGAMLQNLLQQVKDTYGVHYIRLNRKASKQVYEPGSVFTPGKAVQLRDGKDATIIACGYCVAEALTAARSLETEGMSVRVLDMFAIKPIDREAIIQACKDTGAIVTAENHSILNGLGSAVAEVITETIPVPQERVGVHDEYGEVGEVEYLAKRFGLTGEDIAQAVRKAISRKSR